MAIRSDKNLYPGINPHLNSYLQHKTGWRGFRNKFLTYLADAIEVELPSGYYTANEESLQIGTCDFQADMTIGRPDETIPDVAIYRSGTPSAGSPGLSDVSAPVLTLPLALTLDKEEFISSVVIYSIQEGEFPGTPVTRLELLSPENKPGGSYYAPYAAKRQKTLQSGLRLVEIDFLHERRPIIPQIPSYVDRHPDAYPYTILVSDPRPTFGDGKFDLYGASVLDPLPKIPVPLDDADRIRLHLGQVYQQTIEHSGLFQQIADYSQEPVNLAAYTEADQAAIRARMAQIAAEVPPP